MAPDEKKPGPAGGDAAATRETWPSVRQDDAVEPRSFDPAANAPTPKSGKNQPPNSLLGAKGDPAEGKRKP